MANDNMAIETFSPTVLEPGSIEGLSAKRVDILTRTKLTSEAESIQAIRERRACYAPPIEKGKPYKANPGILNGVIGRMRAALVRGGETPDEADLMVERVRDSVYQGIMESNPARVSRAISEPLLYIRDSNNILNDPFKH